MKAFTLRILAYASGWCIGLAPSIVLADPIAADRLEHAFFLEQTVGDWNGAAALYRQVSADPRADESLRAVANERLAARLTVRVPVGADEPKAGAPAEGANAEKLSAALGEAAKAIQEMYAYGVKDEQLLEGALEGMLAKLDGESGYLSAAEVREMSQGIDQQLVGVGLQLKLENGEVLVVAPIPGSPAEKAGIVTGNAITAVGDVTLSDKAEDARLLTAVKLIRGPAGGKVTLTILPTQGADAKTVTVERAPIELESIRGDKRVDGAWRHMLDAESKIGYVRILQFGRRTTDELKGAIDKLKGAGLKALVIDLRDNYGGLLPQAIEAADLFLEGGQIVSIKGKDGMATAHEAKAEGALGDFPIAVIVNRNTASAAEILAAALQDHGRAVIVGERTFGRGIVQSIVPLQTGGAIKLTTGAYTRPSGAPLKRERVEGKPKEGDNVGGVFPSDGQEVLLSDDDIRKYYEYRQERDFPTPGVTGEVEFTDRQLERALLVVRGKIES